MPFFFQKKLFCTLPQRQLFLHHKKLDLHFFLNTEQCFSWVIIMKNEWNIIMISQFCVLLTLPLAWGCMYITTGATLGSSTAHMKWPWSIALIERNTIFRPLSWILKLGLFSKAIGMLSLNHVTFVLGFWERSSCTSQVISSRLPIIGLSRRGT